MRNSYLHTEESLGTGLLNELVQHLHVHADRWCRSMFFFQYKSMVLLMKSLLAYLRAQQREVKCRLHVSIVL